MAHLSNRLDARLLIAGISDAVRKMPRRSGRNMKMYLFDVLDYAHFMQHRPFTLAVWYI
jgi:hypothetical protein